MGMTSTTPDPNKEPTSSVPPRHLVRRSAILTTLIYSAIVIAYVFEYYRNPVIHKFFDLLDFLSPIVIGFLIGVSVIWLVFPVYYPLKPGKEFYPKNSLFSYWLGWFYTGVGILALLKIVDILPLEFIPSGLLLGISTTLVFAFLTYLVFYSALSKGVEKQANASNPSLTIH